MKISVDRGQCIGAGNCVEVAPRYFRQEPGTGMAQTTSEEIASTEDEAEVTLAADVCPVAAILVAGQ